MPHILLSVPKTTNTKVEQANCITGSMLCASGHTDNWDRQLSLKVLTINNKAASTLFDGLVPFFIDSGYTG